jgi:hypothetical protein
LAQELQIKPVINLTYWNPNGMSKAFLLSSIGSYAIITVEKDRTLGFVGFE